MKGAYLLVMKLHKDISIQIGKHEFIKFKEGYYVYVGSALNGLDYRIRHHLRSDKKAHWHIDYLLPYTKIITIFYRENMLKEECCIAQALQKQLKSITGFGCSDCCCKSHLFYGSFQEISQLAHAFQMKRYPLEANS